MKFPHGLSLANVIGCARRRAASLLPGVLPALLPAVCVLLGALALGRWIALAQPQPLPDAGVDEIQCLSYAPFRRPGESPFDPRARVSEARIEADLRILLARTRCVRTYSVQHGLEAVPQVARRLGMTVILGAWIGRDRKANEAELAAAIGLARNHADVIHALVIGNEVLLRRELPEAELAAILSRLRDSVPVPVTYADVWEFWLRHPGLAQAVSFPTIHILPYWEDEPIAVGAAVDHVVSIYRRMQAAFPGQTLLIGETGWPSAGRAREAARPGLIEQARFVRAFAAAAQREALPYNLIEGFDQPWKRRLEGAMGGYWGIFDSEGLPKFELAGPLAERAQAWPGLIAGLLGALAGLGLAIRPTAGVRSHARLPGMVIGLGLGSLTGALLAEQALYLRAWNRDWLEWTVTSAATLVCLAFTWAAIALLLRSRNPSGRSFRRSLRIPGALGVFRAWLRSEEEPRLRGWVGLLLALVLFSGALSALLHMFDARYRGFPWALYAGPAISLVLLRVSGAYPAREALEERWLSGILAAGATWIIATEGPLNGQALGYAALLAALAGAAALRLTITKSPSRAPTAAGS